MSVVQCEHHLDERPGEHDCVDYEHNTPDLPETFGFLDQWHFGGDHDKTRRGRNQRETQHGPFACVLAFRDLLDRDRR